MLQNFWQKVTALRRIQGKPFFVLAPMANVTDFAFRQIVTKCGRPDVFYTEFLSCDGIVYDKNRFKKELYFEKSESPIVVQFFGAKPENFYKCAQLAVKLGFDGIDINMGCPDKNVMKQGGGAALILKPELAKKIIKETKQGASNLPVSVKTRLGYNEIVTEEWLSHLIDAEPAAITVHGRTAKEMSKVPVHWEEINKAANLCHKANITIVGNGDVMTYNEGTEKAKQYSLDGIMVGRGIFSNPWFFNANAENTEHAQKERIELLKKHMELFAELWGKPPTGGKNFDVMKKFFKVYISGPHFVGNLSPLRHNSSEASWEGAKELRTKLMTAKNKEEVVDILSGAL